MNNLILFPLNITISDIIQVALLYFVAYYLIKSIYNTRAWVLAKGLVALAIIYGLFWLAGFSVMTSILDSLFSVLLIGIIIMFQPQLQQIVEKIGSVPIKDLLNKTTVTDSYCDENVIKEILDACTTMSEAKTGALIVIERKIPLVEYSETGIKLDGYISTELLLNIFEKNTPLHDGAVVVKDGKISAATCYLPLSQSKTLSKKFGTRHRAAIGITEVTDAVSIVVSEETGKISLCVDGKIQEVNQAKLTKLLAKEGKLFKKTTRHTPPLFKLAVLIGSVCLWLFILNANDPIKTVKFTNIPVTIQNEQVLLNLNKYYSVTNGGKIDVEVTARNSHLNEITKSDITAVADMKNISITYAVPIEVTVNKKDAQVKALGSSILNVEIEEGKQLEQDIEINIIEQVESEEYLQEIALDNKTVTISGPRSIVDTVDKAMIDIDLNKMQEQYSIVIYDRNGEDITKNLSLNFNAISATPIYLPTKNINLNIKSGKNVITKEILVASKNFNKVKDLTIELEVNDKLTTIYTIDVQKYLPEGVYYAGKEQLEINLEEEVFHD